MLERFGIDVVAYGPSLVDDEHFYLARAFRSLDDREAKLGAFYGSDEWRDSYDDAVSSVLATYHPVVIPLTAPLGRALADSRGAS